MGRFLISNNAITANGSTLRLAPGASIQVNTSAGTAAVLYLAAEGSTTVANPVTADAATAAYSFYVDDGEAYYNLVTAFGGSSVTERVYRPIQSGTSLPDRPLPYASRADLVAAVAAGAAAGWPTGTLVTDGLVTYAKVTSGGISDLGGLLVPYGPCYIEHFGGGTAQANTVNNAALTAWYAAVTAGVMTNIKTLNFMQGTYQYSSFPTININSVGLQGAGGLKGLTILQNTSTTANGPQFGPAESVGTGNNLFFNFVRGIYFYRAATDATAGAALTFRFCAGFTLDDVLIAQHHNGLDIAGGQDFDISNIRIYGMYTASAWLSPKRSGTWLLRLRPAVKADTTLQSIWQGRVSHFTFAGGFNTEVCVLIEGSDGTKFTNGYINGGRDALVKQDGDDQYKGYSFVNTYFDGGRPEQNVEYCFWVPTTDTTAFSYVVLGSGCTIANCKTAIIKVEGNTFTRLTIEGVKFHGWETTPPRIIDFDAPNAHLTMTGFQMLNSHQSIRLTRAASVDISSGNISNGNASLTGTALEINGAVSHFSMSGVNLTTWGGSSAFSDTGSGTRAWVNNTGSWAVAQRSLRLPNAAASDDLTLNWVQRGTFTPTVNFAGGTTGITYTAQSGRFQRIGQWVHFNIRIVLSSKGSSTGELRVTGLPYNARFTESQTFPCPVRFNTIGSTSDSRDIVGDLLVDYIRFTYRSSGAQATLGDGDVTNTTTIMIGGLYEVA